MNITVYDLIYIISNLFTAYIAKLFMDKYLGINLKYKKMVYLVYGAFFLITTSLYFLFSIPVVMMIVNLLCFLGISLCYKGNYKNKIIASFYIYIVLSFVEILVTALTFTPFMSPFEAYGYSNVIGLFIDKVLQFLAVLIVRNVFIKKNEADDDVIPLKISLSFLLIHISIIIIEIFVVGTPNISQNKVILSVIVLFMINCITFALYNSLLEMYRDKIKNVVTAQERDYYYKQCLIMQKAVEETKSFRHDYNNHMSILNEFISKGEILSAKKYISNLREEHQKYTSIIYSSTGNIPIDSVLNYKLNSLPDKNIDINLEINVPTELSVEIMDISTILTNLMDNAISALNKVDKNKKMSIKIIYRKGMLIISIANSYNGTVLYENGKIITTKENKVNNGKGLSNIRKATEKYNGLLKLSHNENIFTSEVLLYLH